MASRIRIAIDCMSGDHGPRSCVPAALKLLNTYTDTDIVLVGKAEEINQFLYSRDYPNLRIENAPDIVAMDEKPVSALRNKPQSSMRIAIDLLKHQKVDAVVSAGNTGALMTMGCAVLRTIPGIERPAICSAIPSGDTYCHLLDLGANVENSAEHLYQFAIMGAALSTAVDDIHNPRVALMNIGAENFKGNEQVQLAAKLIDADRHLNYVGFLEGNDLFSGRADVVVCDGFVGNVALKVCEGTATHIVDVIREKFSGGLFAKCIALFAKPVLKAIYRELNPARYNGASFLGLQGVLVKSHGDSTETSFYRAIVHARSEVENNMLAGIRELIADKLDTSRINTIDN